MTPEELVTALTEKNLPLDETITKYLQDACSSPALQESVAPPPQGPKRRRRRRSKH